MLSCGAAMEGYRLCPASSREDEDYAPCMKGKLGFVGVLYVTDNRLD